MTLTLYTNSGFTIVDTQPITIDILACVTSSTPHVVNNPATDYLDKTYTIYDLTYHPSEMIITLPAFDFSPCTMFVETITCTMDGADLFTAPPTDGNGVQWVKKIDGSTIYVFTED